MLSSKYDKKVGVTVDPKLGQGQHDDNNPSTKQPPSSSSLRARPTASKTDKAECSVHEKSSDCLLVGHQSQIRPIPGSACPGVTGHDWACSLRQKALFDQKAVGLLTFPSLITYQ